MTYNLDNRKWHRRIVLTLFMILCLPFKFWFFLEDVGRSLKELWREE